MIGVFIEPATSFDARMRIPQRGPPTPSAMPTSLLKPNQPTRHRFDCFWTEVVFEILKGNGDGPMLITSIVNESLRWGKFVRGERVKHKLMMFKVIGRLARMRRLERNRQYVAMPASDAGYQAYLAEAAKPLNLPPPLV